MSDTASPRPGSRGETEIEYLTSRIIQMAREGTVDFVFSESRMESSKPRIKIAGFKGQHWYQVQLVESGVVWVTRLIKSHSGAMWMFDGDAKDIRVALGASGVELYNEILDMQVDMDRKHAITIISAATNLTPEFEEESGTTKEDKGDSPVLGLLRKKR